MEERDEENKERREEGRKEVGDGIRNGRRRLALYKREN